MIDDPELPAAGVIPLDGGKVRWCVWAPEVKRVELVLDPDGNARRLPLDPIDRGFHAAEADRPESGARYAYSLDGGPPLPDPRSRRQPEGVHEPSVVWWPGDADWDEPGWAGIDDRRDLVFYELHVGTFTPEGTFDAVVPRLDALKDLGITAIELMPVASFPGRWSWGYDGVFPFAVQEGYGGPDGLRRLVRECHRRGLAVFLDTIYNHFGPEGNVFPQYGPYLTDRYKTDWGPALNFDGRGCDAVRALILDNARMWVRDFHADGLRLDAADQIYDRSPRHILSEVVEVAHAEGDRLKRPVHVFVETDMNDAPRFIGPAGRGGYGVDAHWNDDFHHAAHVALTGEDNGYYMDFAPGPEALAKVYAAIFVNDGRWSPFRGRRHGTTADEFGGDRFLAFTQNHDQVGNRAKSDRNAALLPPSAARLAAGILLLTPRLPLLFMGEEYGETNPFPFFCDFQEPELIEAVRKGRKEEFAYFGWDEVPDPVGKATRDQAVLSWSWDEPRRAGLRRLYADLIRLRTSAPALRDYGRPRVRLLDPGDVLEVVRGEGEGLLRIFLNLSAEDRPLPDDLGTELPSLRSETADYGADAPEADRRFTRLRPHEFAVFGPLG